MYLTVRIKRFNPERDRKPHFEEYQIEVNPTDRVLDALNHETLGGNTALAAVLAPRACRILGHRVEYGVLEHEERVGAAKLQQRLLDDVAGSPGDLGAGVTAAGQGKGCDAWIGDDLGSSMLVLGTSLAPTDWVSRLHEHKTRQAGGHRRNQLLGG